MVSFIEAVFLGMIQGLTEWLPVSSSGHLVIAQQLFDISASLAYDLFLHVATVLVLLIYFRDRIRTIIRDVFSGNFTTPSARLAWFVVVGSLPTAIIGFLFQDYFASFFHSLTVVSIALLVTGSLLFVCERYSSMKQLTLRHSFLIGCVQGLSLIPGISRSGSTIGVGLLLGVEKKIVAEYSFLLAIPAIIGAFAFQISESSFVFESSMLVGFVVAFFIGYWSLSLLMRVISVGKLHYFSYYCWIVGITIIIL